MPLQLPQTVCFRVTRYCNARCGFCLAPPDGAHPALAVLRQRLDWLAARGVRRIHFCGGEPTIHPALPELVAHVHAQGGRTLLTTNGITLPEPLLPVLQRAGTQVKVSLHGDRDHHDTMVGRAAFDLTTAHLRRLVKCGLRPGVHTTLVASHEPAMDWMIEFCLAEGVRQLSFLPFIARGDGRERQLDFGFTPRQRVRLHEKVRGLRSSLRGRLDLRWLDFSARPIHVVEADGRLVLERASDAMDTVLCTLDAEPVPRKRIPLRAAPVEVATRPSPSTAVLDA